MDRNPNSTPRIMVVYGTRPEAIKLSPVIRALYDDPDLEVVVVVTGQHRSMADQVNESFGIEPDIDLDLFRSGQNLNELSSRLYSELDPVYEAESPSAVMVQGDTTSASVAALAAFNKRIPIVHLEAGLRSNDLTSPFPEEANRRLISQLATLNLCPTAEARSNLVLENISPERCEVTGNTVIDALLSAVQIEREWSDPRITEAFNFSERVLLFTSHRRENWGAPLESICLAIKRIAYRFSDVSIIIPMHRNPEIVFTVESILSDVPNIIITSAMEYIEFSRLVKRSYFVITDSGGLQEEAPTLGKPVLVLRNSTERVEALEANTIQLIGTNEEQVFSSISNLLNSKESYASMANRRNPYGAGDAARKSIDAIKRKVLLFEDLEIYQSVRKDSS